MKAGRITQVDPVLMSIAPGWPTAPAPLLNNELIGNLPPTPRTVGVRQYNPVGDADGHFVATTKGQDGRVDAVLFVEQALAGTAPQIGQ